MKDDLDLSVRPPSGNLIWYKDKIDFVTFGELLFDSIPNAKKKWAESINFQDPYFTISGKYEVCVTTFRQVGVADTFTLKISEDVKTISSKKGTNDQSRVWCITYNYKQPPSPPVVQTDPNQNNTDPNQNK